jgi:hypothetical protein
MSWVQIPLPAPYSLANRVEMKTSRRKAQIWVLEPVPDGHILMNDSLFLQDIVGPYGSRCLIGAYGVYAKLVKRTKKVVWWVEGCYITKEDHDARIIAVPFNFVYEKCPSEVKENLFYNLDEFIE